MIEANTILPTLVSIAAEMHEVPALHPSTGLLDTRPASVSANIDELAARYRFADFYDAVPRSAYLSSLRKAIMRQSESDAYTLSKYVMERFIAGTVHSKAVRISNFFGPEYVKPRLIPRLVTHRLRGRHITVVDELRNYLYRDDINEFILRVITSFNTLSGHVLWCYGSATLRVTEIVAKIHEQLPTCYGTADVIRSAVVPVQTDSIPKIQSYFRDMVGKEKDFAEGLSETIRFWRERIQYNFRLWPQRAIVGTIWKGGSVATKRLRRWHGRTVLEKSSQREGFEGAGRAKLRGEIAFYQTLAEDPCHEALSKCFPPLLGNYIGAKKVSLYFDYQCDGHTVADALLAGERIPDDELLALIERAFCSGYLGDLSTINQERRFAMLREYYVDRVITRLSNFAHCIDHSGAPDGVRNLIHQIANGASIRIGSSLYPNPLQLLLEIARYAPLAEIVAPRSEGFCSHGDLTISNILLDRQSGELRLIDPRGRVGSWDPVYDLAKFAFSLSGFAHVVNGAFEYRWNGRAYDLYPDGEPRSYLTAKRMRAAFLRWICTSPIFAGLRRIEQFLLARVQFAESTHYLADVPYRYAINHDYTEVAGVILFGTKYLALTARRLKKMAMEDQKCGLSS